MDETKTIEQPAKRAEQERAPRVAAHYQAFHETMGRLIKAEGVYGKSQASRSYRAYVGHSAANPGPLQPLGRLDRKRLVEEGLKEGSILAKVRPNRVRGVPAVLPPKQIDDWLDRLSDADTPKSPEELTSLFGRMFGYRDADAAHRAALRAGRFITKNSGRRLPMHLRQAGVMATAVMLGVARLFPDQADKATLDGAAALRGHLAGAA